MKKIISILISVCICLSAILMLVSCNEKAANTKGESTATTHTHTYNTKWSKDLTHHWKICDGDECADISEKAEHTWDNGNITTPATSKADGVKTFTCTVCGQTKDETVKYIFDSSRVNCVYSYIYECGIIGVSVNSEGCMLSIDVYDEKYMQKGYSSMILKPLAFKYDELGKMTAVAYDYDAIELSVTAYDTNGRPTATSAAEDGESISFFYDDSAKTMTITFNESKKSCTFDEYNRCILEKSLTSSGNLREKSIVFNGDTGIIFEDGEDTEQRVIYTNTYVLSKLDSGKYDYYAYEYNDSGICTQTIEAENESDDPSNPKYEIYRSVIEYNDLGKILKHTIYYKGVNDNEEELDEENSYEYNSRGLLAKITSLTHYNGGKKITVFEHTDELDLLLAGGS